MELIYCVQYNIFFLLPSLSYAEDNDYKYLIANWLMFGIGVRF